MYIVTTGLNPIESDILCHHGIKGQKWGVRKDRKSADASTLANSIYHRAKVKEPVITKDLKNALRKTSAKFYGFEHRLKTKESIERKINTDSKKRILV